MNINKELKEAMEKLLALTKEKYELELTLQKVRFHNQAIRLLNEILMKRKFISEMLLELIDLKQKNISHLLNLYVPKESLPVSLPHHEEMVELVKMVKTTQNLQLQKKRDDFGRKLNHLFGLVVRVPGYRSRGLGPNNVHVCCIIFWSHFSLGSGGGVPAMGWGRGRAEEPVVVVAEVVVVLAAVVDLPPVEVPDCGATPAIYAGLSTLAKLLLHRLLETLQDEVAVFNRLVIYAAQFTEWGQEPVSNVECFEPHPGCGECTYRSVCDVGDILKLTPLGTVSTEYRAFSSLPNKWVANPKLHMCLWKTATKSSGTTSFKPMASLVLTDSSQLTSDSSQLTSDSQHLELSVPKVDPNLLRLFALRTMVATVRQYKAFAIGVQREVERMAWLHNQPKYPSKSTRTDASRKNPAYWGDACRGEEPSREKSWEQPGDVSSRRFSSSRTNRRSDEPKYVVFVSLRSLPGIVGVLPLYSKNDSFKSHDMMYKSDTVPSTALLLHILSFPRV
uniref:Uncharacterized protein n=1 Tax=Timema shepardi TaxID=629360 RepID=A0A7R9G229_TIMSH|nr:unnamed protein product [Timema shepardi]